MQNRYFGDVGDFGKYGLLRRLCGPDEHGPGFRLGVLWYLVPDVKHGGEGQHISYLRDTAQKRREFRACDPSLWDGLKAAVDAGSRRVSIVRERRLLPMNTMCHETPLFWLAGSAANSPRSRATRLEQRRKWWQDGFALTARCEVVFFDPDIGLEVKMPKYAARAPKYVYWDEITPYWDRGQSIVIYQHSNRSGPLARQVQVRLRQLEEQTGCRDVFALILRRGTARIFLVAPHPEHTARIVQRVREMLDGSWNRHFEMSGSLPSAAAEQMSGRGKPGEELVALAALIRERNAVSARIAKIIGRPAQIGHVGEYIASRVFDIALEESATAKGIDGRFASGPLAGKTVNIKWYGKHEGILDVREDALPEYYLVLTGPKVAPASSRGSTRPWVIDHVFLFEAEALVAELRARGVKIGIATSVARRFWDAAEIYPEQRCPVLPLSDRQKGLLSLFGSGTARE